MQSIPGVRISVLVDNKPLSIADDGFIGNLDTKQLVLRVQVEPGCDIFGFNVDGSKNVVPKKNLVEGPNSGKRYELKMLVRQNDRGQRYTNYPDNNLRLVEQMTEDSAQFNATGTVRIWEISVVSQNGQFFLSAQATYDGTECCRDSRGNCYYPRFDNWPQLQEYLISLLPASVVPAPHYTYHPDAEPTLNGAGPNEGIVQWYNDAQGIGCIVTKQGHARVHWSQIAKRPRRAYLRPGEKVRFKEVRPPMQTSTRGTGFKLEVSGVELA